MSSFDEQTRKICRSVAAIPFGRVATYGDVASHAGFERGHRITARVLKHLPDGSEVPWHRVVAKHSQKKARIAIVEPGTASKQKRLLESERVRVTDAGIISLVEFGW